MNINAVVLPRPAGPLAAPAAVPQRAGTVVRDALVNGLNALVAAASTGSATPILKSALDKLRRATSAISACDNLLDGLAAVLAQQAKQGDQRIGLALATAKSKQEQIKAQNVAERAQIDKRIEAAKSSSFWQRLVNFFKAIGAALSAASSIFTGPAGMVAAGLMIASLVISLAKPDDWGKWLSLGLSLAAIVVGGAGAIHNLVTAGAKTAGELGKAAALTAAEAAKETAKAGAKLGLQLAAAGSEAAAGGCAVAKGYYDAKGLDAQAALAELKALRHKLQAEADEAKDEIELVVEAQARCVKAALKIFESNHGATMRALGR